MSLFSLIVVFLLEQLKPLDYRRWVVRPFGVWADFWERRLNAGDYRHGVPGVCLVLLPPLALGGAVWGLAYWAGAAALLLLNVLVLYATMGFRQFSHFYTDIQLALRLEEWDKAHALLSEWRGEAVSRQGASDLARLAIETALAASHRHVFAVLFWFVLLEPLGLGALGALLYRLTHLLAEHWRQRGETDEFGKFSQQLFAIVDGLPMRVTAAAFAVVGNFEDAVYCWRHFATRWTAFEPGIVLASGAGALGVRLGIPTLETQTPEPLEAGGASGGTRFGAASGSGLGAPADADFMQSAIGLVWRAIALWLLTLFVLGLARWAG